MLCAGGGHPWLASYGTAVATVLTSSSLSLPFQAAISVGNWDEALTIYSTGKNSFSGVSRRTFLVSNPSWWHQGQGGLWGFAAGAFPSLPNSIRSPCPAHKVSTRKLMLAFGLTSGIYCAVQRLPMDTHYSPCLAVQSAPCISRHPAALRQPGAQRPRAPGGHD